MRKEERRLRTIIKMWVLYYCVGSLVVVHMSVLVYWATRAVKKPEPGWASPKKIK